MEVPARIESDIQNRIASGRYGSSDEVLDKALKALDWLELREEAAHGLAALDRGEFSTYTDETLGELFDEVRHDPDERAG